MEKRILILKLDYLSLFLFFFQDIWETINAIRCHWEISWCCWSKMSKGFGKVEKTFRFPRNCTIFRRWKWWPDACPLLKLCQFYKSIYGRIVKIQKRKNESAVSKQKSNYYIPGECSLRFQLHDVVVNKQSRSNVWRTHDSLLGSSLLAQQRFKSHNYMGYLISVLFTRITPLIWKFWFMENDIYRVVSRYCKYVVHLLSFATSVDHPV